MSDAQLRKSLIRLAAQREDLRSHLLPLLAGKTAAGKEVFRAETQGKRYQVVVEEDGGKYNLEEFTRGRSSGRGTGYTKDQMVKRVTNLLRDAKQIDKINYKVVKNDLGVRVASKTAKKYPTPAEVAKVSASAEDLRPHLLPLLASERTDASKNVRLREAAVPSWQGADAVYSYLYKVLEKMGKENWAGEVARAKKRRVRPKSPTPTDDMKEIMKALDKGDEETLKDLHQRYKIRRYASAGKTAKRYPTPAEVAKVSASAAKAIYDARGKKGGLSDLSDALRDAYEDSKGSGVSFSGDVATKFSKRLGDAKDALSKLDQELMSLASRFEALARDLKKA